MSNAASVATAGSSSIPKVLLQAKKEAATQASGETRGWDKGPWDKGHWANRK